jgi:hypothetical protein
MNLRKNHLEKLTSEKDKRTNIYKALKNKLAFLDGRGRIKHALFGNTDVRDLTNDLSIPPQSDLTLYLKALRPAELDSHFERTDRWLTYQIHKAKKQIAILEHIAANPKAASRYERKNFEYYFQCDDSQQQKLDQDVEDKLRNKNELKELIKYMKDLFDNKKTFGADEAIILRDLYSYIKEKGYDIFNLSEDQRRDLYVQKDKIHQQVNIRREFGLDTFFRDKRVKRDRQFQTKRYYTDMSSDYTDLESIPQEERLSYTKEMLKGTIKQITGKDSKEVITQWKEQKEKEALARKEKQEEIERIAMAQPKRMRSIKKSKRTIPMQFATRETYN